MNWLKLVLDAVEIVTKAIAEGATDEEIAERLRAPGTVGAALLEGVEGRKARREEYKRGGR